MNSILEFIYPKTCAACTAIKEEGGLFCLLCRETIEFIDFQGRCFRCFSLKRRGFCDFCRKKYTPFVRKTALFESMTPICRLWNDQDRFAKTIAAFFVLRFLTTRSEYPDYVFSEKNSQKIGKEVASILKIPRVKYYRKISAGSKVLWIAEKMDSEEIPHFLLLSKVHYLAFKL